MGKKFISDSESEFAVDARNFADTIARDPKRYNLDEADVGIIQRAVEAFEACRAACACRYTASPQALDLKQEARIKLVRIMRRYGNRIRADETIHPIDKSIIRVFERPKKLRRSKCPRTRPALMFQGATGQSGTGDRKHILAFREKAELFEETKSGTRAKPAGVERVELYADFVAEGEEIPQHPGAWPLYLGSFKKNPIRVECPMPPTPMRVIYWARWAGSDPQDRGPFSMTCVAQLEGAVKGVKALPDVTEIGRRQRIVITTARPELPDPTLTTEDASSGMARLLTGNA
jgi:hypothetical protein